jgi:hypothetical protein
MFDPASGLQGALGTGHGAGRSTSIGSARPRGPHRALERGADVSDPPPLTFDTEGLARLDALPECPDTPQDDASWDQDTIAAFNARQHLLSLGNGFGPRQDRAAPTTASVNVIR